MFTYASAFILVTVSVSGSFNVSTREARRSEIPLATSAEGGLALKEVGKFFVNGGVIEIRHLR